MTEGTRRVAATDAERLKEALDTLYGVDLRHYRGDQDFREQVWFARKALTDAVAAARQQIPVD